MKISDLIPIVSKSAPVLGTLLGSPFAGMGISLLLDYFKVDDKNDLKGLADAIVNNPAKLKEIEYKHKEAMQLMLMNFLQESEKNIPRWMAGVVTIIMALAALAYLFGGNLNLGS